MDRALDYGVATAAIGALVWIVRAFLSHITANQQRMETFLGNHMSATTRALEGLAAAVEQMRRDLAPLAASKKEKR